MVAVGGIVVGREHRREHVACAVAHLAEEGGAWALVVPVADQGDAAAVLQPEAGDVDRIGGGMLAPRALAAPIDAAAIVASEMLDFGDAAPEMLERGGLDDVPFP
jgi:hypothetical protein